MADFVRDLLRHYVCPLSVGGKSWRVVLSFQALYNRFIPDACRVDDFFALYMIRKTKGGEHFFTVKSGFERLVVNLADNDHGWHDTVIRIHEAWEMVMRKDHGTIPIVWSKGTLVHREIPIMTEVEKRVWSLLQIEIDYSN